MMKPRIFNSINLIFFFALVLIAGKFGYGSSFSSLEKNQTEHTSVLNKFVKKLSNSEELLMDVEKNSFQSLLERKSSSSGKISVSKSGKFWWKIEKPEQSLLVFDGQLAWNEERLSEDFGGGVKVAKSKHFKASPVYKILKALMGKGSILDYFTPLKTKRTKDLVELQLTPNSGDWNISLLTIVIEEKKQSLLSIKYIDDLENETELKFSNHKRFEKINKSRFKYVIPKNAEVTEL